MQRCCLENERFHVLKVAVTEDNMQMSTFIKSRLGSFENGQAFYEFIGHEEDLVYYKQVINILTTEKVLIFLKSATTHYASYNVLIVSPYLFPKFLEISLRCRSLLNHNLL